MKQIENLQQIFETTSPVTILPDGSGFFTGSLPLPKDHWLYEEGINNPPMPFRMGTSDPRRQEFEQLIEKAARYAVRASTINGTEEDYDPDAMVRNFIIGMLGYYTEDGLSGLEDWMNPDPIPAPYPGTPHK